MPTDERTATLTLDQGRRSAFRYLDSLGRWYDDPQADDIEATRFGTSNSIIDLTNGLEIT